MFKSNVKYLLLSLIFSISLFAQNQQKTSTLSYDAELSNYKYAFEVNFFHFNSQNQALKMAYMYLKGDKNKATITLMHGKNFNADYWTSTASYLHAQGYNVLIPDQIGFGKSSKPMHYQFSFPVLAKNTRTLLNELNITKSIVIGHSMGGMLASRFALMYPNFVQKLILVNPIGLENYLMYVEYKDTNFFYKNELAKTADKIKNYQQKNYYDGQWNEKYEALTHFMIGQIQGPDKEQISWVNALTYDMIFSQAVITEFKDFLVPVKLIIGTRDRTGPGRKWKKPGVSYELGRYDKLGKSAASLISDVSLYELKGLGHLPQIENFERFISAVNSALENSENK